VGESIISFTGSKLSNITPLAEESGEKQELDKNLIKYVDG